MKKVLCFLSFFILISTVIFPQNSSEAINTGVLSSILRLENYIQTTDENLQRYQNSIDRCDKNIRNSTEILDAARKSGDSQSASSMQTAIDKLKRTKERYVNLISIAKEKKVRFQGTITILKNNLQAPLQNFTGAILSSRGDVTITRANGKKIKLQDLNISSLESGDVLNTGKGGRVELQCVDGRGNLIIGEKSQVAFTKKDSVDVISILDGKLKMDVEKLEAFQASMVKGYHNIVATVQSPDSVYNAQLEKLKARLQKKFELRNRCGGTASIRGTQFIVECKEGITEITVTEGLIDLQSGQTKKSVAVAAGQLGILSDDGQQLEVKQIDNSKIEAWWKDEE